MLSGLFGNSGVNGISPMELSSKLKNGAKPLLLDVREANELTSGVGKIDGVINIPVGSIMGRAKELESHKNDEIIVICHSGARANSAGKVLKQLGFENVAVLSGGMLGWRREGL